MDQPILNNNNSNGNHNHNHNTMAPAKGAEEELPQTPVVNRREKILRAFFSFVFSLFNTLVILLCIVLHCCYQTFVFPLKKKEVVQLK